MTPTRLSIGQREFKAMKIKAPTAAVILSAVTLLFDLISVAPRAQAQGGVPLWTNRYSDAVTGDAIAWAAAVDSSGNVFARPFVLSAARVKAEEGAEEIEEATDIANNINEMSSRGGEASGAAASGRERDGRPERQRGAGGSPEAWALRLCFAGRRPRSPVAEHPGRRGCGGPAGLFGLETSSNSFWTQKFQSFAFLLQLFCNTSRSR